MPIGKIGIVLGASIIIGTGIFAKYRFSKSGDDGEKSKASDNTEEPKAPAAAAAAAAKPES